MYGTKVNNILLINFSYLFVSSFILSSNRGKNNTNIECQWYILNSSFFSQLQTIDFNKNSEPVSSSFFSIYTHSITNGLVWGLLLYCVIGLKTLLVRCKKEIKNTHLFIITLYYF